MTCDLKRSKKKSIFNNFLPPARKLKKLRLSLSLKYYKTHVKMFGHYDTFWKKIVHIIASHPWDNVPRAILRSRLFQRSFVGWLFPDNWFTNAIFYCPQHHTLQKAFLERTWEHLHVLSVAASGLHSHPSSPPYKGNVWLVISDRFIGVARQKRVNTEENIA